MWATWHIIMVFIICELREIWNISIVFLIFFPNVRTWCLHISSPYLNSLDEHSHYLTSNVKFLLHAWWASFTSFMSRCNSILPKQFGGCFLRFFRRVIERFSVPIPFWKKPIPANTVFKKTMTCTVVPHTRKIMYMSQESRESRHRFPWSLQLLNFAKYWETPSWYSSDYFIYYRLKK